MNPVVGCHHLPPGPQRHTCTSTGPFQASGFPYRYQNWWPWMTLKRVMAVILLVQQT